MTNVSYAISGRRVQSPNLWGNCPFEALLDPQCNKGGIFFDDFRINPTYRYTYAVVSGSGASTANTFHATEPHTSYLLTGGTAEDSVVIGTAPLYNFANSTTTTSPSGKRCWFEGRIALSHITDQSMFLGLGTSPVACAQLTDDTGVLLATGNFVGFHIANTASSTINAVYLKDSATGATIVAAQTAVATTFYRLGFSFDGVRYLKVYVDDVLMHTEDVNALLATGTTTWPIVNLGMSALYKEGAGAAKSLGIDWWAFAWEGDET